MSRNHGPTKILAGQHQVPFEDAWRFIVKVGVAAHKYGSTAGRLEMFLQRLSTMLGYRGAFRSTPSEMVFALRESRGRPQRVELVTMPTPGMDLNKLARVGDLLVEVKAGTLSLAEASDRLDAVDRTPPPWGHVANTISYVLVGLGVAALLGGGWTDMVYSTLFGMLVYGSVTGPKRIFSLMGVMSVLLMVALFFSYLTHWDWDRNHGISGI